MNCNEVIFYKSRFRRRLTRWSELSPESIRTILVSCLILLTQVFFPLLFAVDSFKMILVIVDWFASLALLSFIFSTKIKQRIACITRKIQQLRCQNFFSCLGYIGLNIYFISFTFCLGIYMGSNEFILLFKIYNVFHLVMILINSSYFILQIYKLIFTIFPFRHRKLERVKHNLFLHTFNEDLLALEFLNKERVLTFNIVYPPANLCSCSW